MILIEKHFLFIDAFYWPLLISLVPATFFVVLAKIKANKEADKQKRLSQRNFIFLTIGFTLMCMYGLLGLGFCTYRLFFWIPGLGQNDRLPLILSETISIILCIGFIMASVIFFIKSLKHYCEPKTGIYLIVLRAFAIVSLGLSLCYIHYLIMTGKPFNNTLLSLLPQPDNRVSNMLSAVICLTMFMLFLYLGFKTWDSVIKQKLKWSMISISQFLTLFTFSMSIWLILRDYYFDSLILVILLFIWLTPLWLLASVTLHESLIENGIRSLKGKTQ